MSRRRLWIIGAQAGLTSSLLALMWVESPAEQIGLLMLISILINSFTATQDVAADGMAIDVMANQKTPNAYRLDGGMGVFSFASF